MLASILAIIKRGNQGFANRGRFYRLQTGAKRITNRASLRELKDLKSGKILQIWAIRNTKRGRDFISGPGLQIGPEQYNMLFVSKNSYLKVCT